MDVDCRRELVIGGRKLSDVQEIGSPEGENGEPSHLSSIDDDRLKGMTDVKGIASAGSTGSLERQNADPRHPYEQLEKKLSEMHNDIINLKDEVPKKLSEMHNDIINLRRGEIAKETAVGG